MSKVKCIASTPMKPSQSIDCIVKWYSAVTANKLVYEYQLKTSFGVSGDKGSLRRSQEFEFLWEYYCFEVSCFRYN